MVNVEKQIKKRIMEDNYGKNDPLELFHPSSAGYCRRQIFLSKLGVKVFPDHIRGAMQSGTNIHEWIQSFPEVKESFFFPYS